ncbi:hypothetical protein BCV69DRAFT_298389 [Microstroma glucosiphilum]|uniref:Small ribosomal subunit protein mS23 n=1 Tax=Pseudomicrostroma glucosiphilum TaxID=1684307 RepID=A0A316UA70_9BASI|nr:hypothetical protein BCV69DRAFT_298389 [Pseudomicrostroma glucosiphilum]PWN21371.1 hypothetical protein BCV69DRAFT_298389 [Pseudomicrostroma glucosiphilum]
MPRRIAAQVPQTISRLMQGGYIKTPPVSYQALLAHPPTTLPPRAPYPRPTEDLPESLVKAARNAEGDPSRRRDPMNSKKKMRTRTPSLAPQPIVYLHDRVRRQFYLDHPWEGLRPRILAEKEKVEEPAKVPAEVTELTRWSTNPQPEDVIALTVHLHENHSLSLAKAYRHALGQYHSLRAEHETASRYALLEAQAYGAQFNPPAPKFLKENYGNRVWHAAPETYRGFLKEEQALESWAAAAQGPGAALSTSQAPGAPPSKMRMRPESTGEWSGGDEYRRGARAILEGKADALANAQVKEEGTVVTTDAMVGTPENDPLRLSLLQSRLEERAIEAGRARR